MINSNKILTVSYGTFSCTLEGFDDSFGTMKAIAEYFRDLSADDRYFGAEPVQPDAQMLAHIAQREISRHVDAREDEGRIVLSARSSDEEAAAPAAQVARDIPEAPVEEAVAQEEKQPEPAITDTSSVIEDIAEIEEAVAVEPETVEEPVTEEIAEGIKEVSADPIAEEAEQAPAQADDAAHDIVPSLPDADVEAFFAESVSSDAAAHDATEDSAEQMPAQMRAKADSIAEKLKRIRAVVSQQPEEDAAPDYSEDQHADANKAAVAMADIADEQPEAADDDDMLSATLRDIEDALDEDDTHEVETAADEAFAPMDIDEDDEDDDIAAILSRLEDEAGDDSDIDLSLADDDAPTSDDTADNILAAIEEDADQDDADNMFGEEPEDVAEAPAPAATPAPVKRIARVKAPAPRARVLKVKRATLEAAIKSGQLEEYDDEEDAAKAAPAKTSSLSEEDEKELARELAELEADMKASSEAPSVEPEVDEQPAEAEIPHAKLDADADESFSRLMEETEQQMEEPESSTRRDAFAHLRAAVAAKKADEAVGGNLGSEDSDEAYRDDLASVVRPRRPTGSDRPRTERPAEQRPAPLKLVAEQRIDTAEPRRVTPVRPRRVAAAPVAPAPEPDQGASEVSSFEDFAAEMGAQALPDLLEAAAAYLSFVEGHEEFSRPQLMTKVRQVEKENFTREDGLRSFGKLLREGKIQKLSGGRFQASDQIGFKPGARAAS